jgi:hypothetical protein
MDPLEKVQKYVTDIESRFVSCPARIPPTYRLVTVVLLLKYQALSV